jgi:hypothetical protein
LSGDLVAQDREWIDDVIDYVLQKCSRLKGRSAIQDRSWNLSNRGGSSGLSPLPKSKPIHYTKTAAMRLFWV